MNPNQQPHNHPQPDQLINENLEHGDLKRLVHDELHIDEYKSKMGSDADICVLSFKVKGKNPSNDLVNFLENGYDFVLDADVSSGETDHGNYLVFVELERTDELPQQIMEIVTELLNLTQQSLADWRFQYHKNPKHMALSVEALKNSVPLSADSYEEYHDNYQSHLDAMRAAAGVTVDTRAPHNELTESLRIAAGIR
jgi:hypothetical protein